MYKVRPLDDNPVEHTGLHMPDSVLTLNTVSIFVIYLLHLPLLFSLRLSEG